MEVEGEGGVGCMKGGKGRLSGGGKDKGGERMNKGHADSWSPCSQKHLPGYK